jgi:hypothetical protein
LIERERMACIAWRVLTLRTLMLRSLGHAPRDDLLRPARKPGKHLFTNIYSILSRAGIAYEAG